MLFGHFKLFYMGLIRFGVVQYGFKGNKMSEYPYKDCSDLLKLILNLLVT